MIVHYSGDFREAWQRRQAGSGETYYGHGYILDELHRLAARHGESGYLSCLAPRYAEQIGGGVTLMGGGTDPLRHAAAIVTQIRDYAPTHLVLHGPMLSLLRQCQRLNLPLACMFADSFAEHPIIRHLRFPGMVGLLNDPRITMVGNHGVNAARGLVDLGVNPDKVIAWDFPHGRRPDAYPPRSDPGQPPHELLYVGSLERKKGVGDALRAVALLRDALPVRLTIIGAGQKDRFEALARKLGVADRVDFPGRMDNNQVFTRMQQAAAILVPSRHAFPEGLPLTLYEALASRTPVIASDHPMFAGHLRDGETAMVFPSASPSGLAAAIASLFRDPILYARLSKNSGKAWEHMQVATKWGDVIDHWAGQSAQDQAWLHANSLA